MINYMKKNISNKPDDKQLASYYEWNKILEKRDSLPYASLDHLFLSLHTYVPPRRQWDYARLKVYTNSKENPTLDHNHIHLYNKKQKSPYIFLNEYKTHKYYDDYIDKNIPQEFIDIIKKSIQTNPREYIIQTIYGKPYDNINSFTQRINRRLKKIFDNDDVTVNSLRHSLSTLLDKVPNMTHKEKEYFARRMGHSVIQSFQYAFINNTNNTSKLISNAQNAKNILRQMNNTPKIINIPQNNKIPDLSIIPKKSIQYINLIDILQILSLREYKKMIKKYKMKKSFI